MSPEITIEKHNQLDRPQNPDQEMAFPKPTNKELNDPPLGSSAHMTSTLKLISSLQQVVADSYVTHQQRAIVLKCIGELARDMGEGRPNPDHITQKDCAKEREEMKLHLSVLQAKLTQLEGAPHKQIYGPLCQHPR